MQLVKTVSEEGALPELSVTFNDGRTVNSTDPDDVFNDSFIQSTRIAEIAISTYHHTSQGASITFRKARSSPIRLTVNGDRSAALIFEGNLINELAASKQWYSPFVLSYYPWYLFGMVIIGLIWTLAFVALNLSYITKLTFDFIFSKAFMPAVIFWPLTLILLEIAFPPIIFNLGHGARRQKVRTVIVSLIFVSIVIGVLVNLSSDFLKDWLTGSASGTHS
jgi:hypothetical protein